MKKTILIIAIAIIVAVIATVNITLSNSKTKSLSALQLANIEALAKNEDGSIDLSTCHDDNLVEKDGTGKFYYSCPDKTTSSKAYPCPDDQTEGWTIYDSSNLRCYEDS